MCNFLSVIVLKNGDVLHHPMLDSHSDLVAYFNLPDTSAHHQHFAKAELVPQDWLDPDTWAWQIDEPTRPGWLDDVDGSAEARTRAIARKMILTEHTPIPRLIVDGCWIVGGKGVVRDVRGGRIIRVQDSGQVGEVRDSGRVGVVRGSGQVGVVRDSGRVGVVWGSGQVGVVGSDAIVNGTKGPR